MNQNSKRKILTNYKIIFDLCGKGELSIPNLGVIPYFGGLKKRRFSSSVKKKVSTQHLG